MTSKTDYECAVIGLGAMGLACAAFLSEHKSIIGFEQYTFDHSMGSSACESKIFRFSCFEGMEYSRLAKRSFELWNEITEKTGISIFLKTGVLMIGAESSSVITKTKECESEIGECLQMLESKDIKKMFPAFYVPDDQVGIFDPSSGVLLPSPAHKALLDICSANGAVTCFSTPVEEIEVVDKKYISIRTTDKKYTVQKVVLCAGPWINKWISQFMQQNFRNLINIQRIVPMWFRPKNNLEYFSPPEFTTYYWDIDGHNQLYGFPLVGNIRGGVKVGLDSDRILTTASSISRVVTDSEIHKLRKILSRYIPSLNGKLVRGQPCMFSMSPDSDFIIGPLANHENIFIVGGFSGRGYKFVPAVGEILCDLLTKGCSQYYCSKFDPNRFIN